MMIAHLKLGNLQRCRARQGAVVVCPDAESGSLESGRAHFFSLKSRHRGARPRHNQTTHPSCGPKKRDQLSAARQFGYPAREQNPLKTDRHTAV